MQRKSEIRRRYQMRVRRMLVDQRPGQSTLIIMQGVRKIARSGSLIVEELFGGKNKRVEVDPAEVEYESGFNGR